MAEQDRYHLPGRAPQTTLVGTRRTAMLWLFLTSGARKREISNLQLEDLHWDLNTMRVLGKGQIEREAPFVQQSQLAVLKYMRHRQDELPWLWVRGARGPQVVQRLSYDGLGEDMDRLRDPPTVRVP